MLRVWQRTTGAWIMDRGERRRQAKDDEKQLARGIDFDVSDANPTAAMMRLLFALVEKARRTGTVDDLVKFLHSRVNASLDRLRDVPVACKKGCSHCCKNIWVSASAPEVLYVATIIRRRGEGAIARVREADAITRQYDFETRSAHPTPCPMLHENSCSIYEFRPRACRLAFSTDAGICARFFNNLSNEDIPSPVIFNIGRIMYSIALAGALRRANLPYQAYEFNSALVCALGHDDAEKAWLGGEDIFAHAKRDTSGDVFSDDQARMMYDHAFSD